MVDTLVFETNHEGLLVVGTTFQLTSVIEMRAYIGVYKGLMESVDEFFN